MIGIIDYNAGNLKSVCNTLARMNVDCIVASTPDSLKDADKIIFPGVGHAKSCMQEVKARGFDGFLQTTQKPVLGICVGMQLLFDFSEEGDTECLGIIDGTVKKFDINTVHIVPHMGWNSVQHNSSALFSDIPQSSDFYFVHSYYCDPENVHKSIAHTEYNQFLFCSAVQHKNFFGVQFHPEKSGQKGEQILQNFIDL